MWELHASHKHQTCAGIVFHRYTESWFLHFEQPFFSRSDGVSDLVFVCEAAEDRATEHPIPSPYSIDASPKDGARRYEVRTRLAISANAITPVSAEGRQPFGNDYATTKHRRR